MQRRTSLVAHGESSEAMQPGQGALDDPTCPTETAAVTTIATRQNGPDAPTTQFGAVTLRVVAAVALHRVGSAPGRARLSADRGHPVDEVEQLRQVVVIGGGQRRDERNPVRVGENMMLRPGLAAIGRVRSSFFPPRTARSEALSTTARSNASTLRPRSSASRTACSRFQTPARCQRTSRRQQVMPDPHPISCGSMFHGIPLRSTKRMPVSTARSGIGLRPAYRRWRDRRFGRSGSMCFHNSSSTNGLVMHDHLHVGHAKVPMSGSKYKRELA